MAKEKIPLYDICSLADNRGNPEVFIEGFSAYLKRHDQSLRLPHRHSFYHMVMFTKGSGSHSIDFQRFTVRSAQIYFMSPGQAHSWKFEGETDGYIINFAPSLFQSFLLNQFYLERFDFFSGNSQQSVYQLPSVVYNKLIELFGEMMHIQQYASALSLDHLRLLLLQVFMEVQRSRGDVSSKTIPSQKQMLMRNFQKLINQHYRSLKLPKEYADLLYVTANHLNALSQDLMGKTAGELIRDRVILEAKRLLTGADITVKQIAEELNFQDNAYFNRFFKKYTGTTPEKFRSQFYYQKK